MPERVVNKETPIKIGSVEEIVISDKLRGQVLDGVLNWENHPHVKKAPFEEFYRKGLGDDNEIPNPTKALIGKYTMARILIEDGRYRKPQYLVQHFIPEDYDLDPETLDQAKQLKGSLSLLLIKKGDVSTTSEEAKDAEDYLAGKYERSKALSDLTQAGVPVEVIGQIITLEECSEMTDEKKLEEFRSWTIHTILRPYLGKLAGRRPERDFTVVDLMDRIPKQVFTHPYAIRYNLIANYFAKQLRQCINELGPQAGIEAIEAATEQITDPDRKKFFETVYEEVYDSITYPYKGDFRETIQIKGKDRIFPCAEQATFTHDSIHHDTRLFVADPGLGKTGGGYHDMENTDAESVLVVAPAQVRPVWREQDEVVFRTPGNVFLIESSSDIEAAVAFPRKYVAVSRDLLGRTKSDSELLPKLIDMAIRRRMDGSIVDEIHNFTNPHAASTKALRRLLEVIHQNYKEKTGKEVAPVIGLTATPIRKSLEDFNVIMAMLWPNDYAATPAEATETRKTFSDRCLRNPHLTYIALTGERRMFRWESGSREFDYTTLPIKASPFEELLADFVNSEVAVDALNKIRLIENAFFNPLLVRNEVLHLAKGNVPHVDIDDAIEILRKSLAEWKKMRGISTPQTQEDYLSVDRLVELGLGKVVLGCFFSGLPNGIDSLVGELIKDTADPAWVDLKSFWEFRDISTKYRVLRQQLEDSLTWRIDPDGTLVREKVIIISPARKQGRTGDVLQREITDGNGSTTHLYSQDDLDRINDAKLVTLIKQWTQGLCDPDEILLLDGSIAPVGPKRDAVISRFANDPDAAVLVLTLEAASQGRDFTLNQLVDEEGRKITGVHNIFLGPTWDSRQLWQMIGRSVRQERLVPVRSTILEILDSVEQGKGEVVRFTGLLDAIVLSGATLHPGDQEFLDSKRVGSRVLRYRSPEAQFLRDAFAFVKGQDPYKIQEFLRSRNRGQEKTNAQLLAERFHDGGRDAYKTTGYNAEMIASLISKFGFESDQILSLGAGTLLLQRKLKRGIDNVDYNSHMMEAGWQEAQVYGGRTIVADAAKLDIGQFPSAAYGFIESAFALDWAALGDVQKNLVDNSVRVQVLSQINRLLRSGGIFALTLPEKTLDNKLLEGFINTLEAHFGFKVDREHSGKSYGISKFGTTKRLGWCIIAQKVNDPNLNGLNLKDLAFCIDNRFWESDYKEKQNGNGNGNGVVRDYPDIKLKFEHYKIVGSSGEETAVDITDGTTNVPVNGSEQGGTAEVAKEEDVVVENLSTIDLTFLRGDTKEDFRSFKRDLIRPLTEITGMNWTEAEEYGINLLQDIVKKSRLPRNRVIAYSWILKEAKRRLRGN